jgi:hypothetical protein
LIHELATVEGLLLSFVLLLTCKSSSSSLELLVGLVVARGSPLISAMVEDVIAAWIAVAVSDDFTSCEFLFFFRRSFPDAGFIELRL